MKLLVVAVCCLCLVVATAASSDDLALAVADAQHDNLGAMAKYTWHVKSEEY